MTGVDLVARDFEGEASRTSLLISSAVDRSLNLTRQIVVLDQNDSTAPVKAITQEVVSLLRSKNDKVTFSPWQTVEYDPEVVYLLLDSCSDPILHNASEEQFGHLRRLITRPNNILWAVLPGLETDSAHYEAGLITGIARTARSENESLRLVTLDASRSPRTNIKSLSGALVDVLIQAFTGSYAEEISRDFEYVYIHDQILIPRLIPDIRTNLQLDASSGQSKLEPALFHHHERPQKLDLNSLGLLDGLRFLGDDECKSSLGANELEIQALAHGVNFKDVFIALGQMPANVPMAGECAGLVTAVGARARTEFAIGDRVCALNATPYSSRARVHASCVHKIPDNMSFSVAASIPVVFATAFYCLVEVARLRKNNTVLIHAASGGVGQAAVKVAQYIGAEIFVTVGSSSKREVMTRQNGIPETHIFSSRTANFKKGILRLTGQKGVDVVLNSMSGQALLDTWECVASYGTFVEIGKTDIYRNNNLSMAPFDRNVSFSSVDLSYLSRDQPARIQALMVKVFDLLKSGHLTPLSRIITMPISDIEVAFRMIQSRSHMGKLVLESHEHTVVKSADARRSMSRLSSNGTYVIAGGLGALGLKLCQYMSRLGAGHILILSRQPPNEDAKQVFEQLKMSGTNVLSYQCDIVDAKQVQDAACSCHTILPPVKGVVQGTMILKVSEVSHLPAFGLSDRTGCHS